MSFLLSNGYRFDVNVKLAMIFQHPLKVRIVASKLLAFETLIIQTSIHEFFTAIIAITNSNFVFT